MKILKNIHSQMIKVNGRDVHYYTAGQGEPLVVIHGGLGNAGDWIDNIEMLSGKYKLYVPDLPGFGESQLLDQEHSIPVFTQFVEDFTETLMLKNFFLMGHSIGGGVALNYALKFPAKVKKLVLVSSLCLGREIAFWVRLMSIQAQVLGSAILAILKSTKWVIDTLTLPVKFIMPFSRANVNLGTNIATLKEQTWSCSTALTP